MPKLTKAGSGARAGAAKLATADKANNEKAPQPLTFNLNRQLADLKIYVLSRADGATHWDLAKDFREAAEATLKRLLLGNFMQAPTFAPTGGGAVLCFSELQEVVESGGLAGFDAIGVMVATMKPSEALHGLAPQVAQMLFDEGFVVIDHEVRGDTSAIWAMKSGHLQTVDHLGVKPVGVAAMSSLGSNGRFANQLFQYAFIKLYALRHGLACATPDWPGRHLFNLKDDDLPEYPLREMRFFAFDNDDLALWSYNDRPVYADFWGYFQEIPEVWRNQRPLLRRLFTPVAAIASEVSAVLDDITDHGNRTLVAIHVRRGDYAEQAKSGLDWYEPIPTEAYQHWLAKLWPTLANPVLYVATDEPESVLSAFAKFNPVQAPASDGRLISPEHLDFEILRAASHLAIANSSFSRMAAILADDRQSAVIYRPNDKAFTPYDAWADREFWQRFQGAAQARNPLGGSDPGAALRRGLEARIQRGDALVALQQAADQTAGEAAAQESMVSVALAALGENLRIDRESIRADSERLRSDLTATIELSTSAASAAYTVRSQDLEKSLAALSDQLAAESLVMRSSFARTTVRSQDLEKSLAALSDQLAKEAVAMRSSFAQTDAEVSRLAQNLSDLSKFSTTLSERNAQESSSAALVLRSFNLDFAALQREMIDRVKRTDAELERFDVAMVAQGSAAAGQFSEITSRMDLTLRAIEGLSGQVEALQKVTQSRSMRGIARRLKYRLHLTQRGFIQSLFGWAAPHRRIRLGEMRNLLLSRAFAGYRKALSNNNSPKNEILEPISSNIENITINIPILIDADSEILLLDGSVKKESSNNIFLYSPKFDGKLPTVSVIIPCYNYGVYLEECVNSVLGQTLADIETIIVDNGSADPLTIEIVDRYMKDPRVTVIRLTPNRGLPAARNAGISEAHSKYVCCIDADDLFASTYLEKAMALLAADCSLGFVYPWVNVFGADEFNWETRDFDPFDARLDNHTSVCGVYRKSDWEHCGRFNPAMHGGYDDWEFWIRLASLGRRGRAIREALFLHRKHASNMTGSAHSTREKWIAKLQELNPDFFENDAHAERLRSLKAARRPTLSSIELHAVLEPATADLPHMLVFAPWLPIGGGAEALLIEQLRHFKSRWRISILTTVSSDNRMTPVFAEVTPQIYHLPDFLDESDWFDFIVSLMKDRGTQMVFSSGSQYLYQNAERLRLACPGLKFADLLHNDLPDGHIKAAITNTAAIDLHFVISGKIQRSLISAQIKPDKIKMIENGVDTERLFRPETVTSMEARASLGIPSSAFVLTYVGRLSPEKRPLIFLDILEALADVPDIHGLLVGSGPLDSAIDDRMSGGFKTPLSRLGQRAQDTLPEIYAASDALVIPSFIEGQPFALLEALATGCPGACTSVGDIPRIITDGVNGFLADRDNPLQLVQKLRAFAGDPSLRIAARTAAVRSISDAKMTRESMLSAYDQAFEELLGSPTQRSPEIAA